MREDGEAMTSHAPLYYDTTIEGQVIYTCDCGEATAPARDRTVALGLLAKHMTEMGESA
jgi:hypothetical protein